MYIIGKKHSGKTFLLYQILKLLKLNKKTDIFIFNSGSYISDDSYKRIFSYLQNKGFNY